MRFAVVGHVEWVEFAKVERVPEPGEIVQAADWWAEAAGGGGVASVRLARLADASTLYTALGRDELGDKALAQLTQLGVRVEATRHAEPQRRGFTFVDGDGERTITIIGEKHVPRGGDPLPWDELAGDRRCLLRERRRGRRDGRETRSRPRRHCPRACPCWQRPGSSSTRSSERQRPERAVRGR